MAETLLQYQTTVAGPDGTVYRARACGSETETGTWQGWIEFDPVALPAGVETIRSPRETTQPNRADAEYWATGLTPVYLEGALDRALQPETTVVTAVEPPVFDGPAPTRSSVTHAEPGHPAAILDPFSVYEKGELLLRRQLAALSPWHLVNIILEYELSPEDRSSLSRRPAATLIDIIVSEVESQIAGRS